MPSLRARLFVTMAVALTAVGAAMTVAASVVYQRATLADARAQLTSEAAAVAGVLEDADDEVAALEGDMFEGVRMTLVSPTGEVLFDSAVDAATLPNHADRPEVADALATGVGTSERMSETMDYVSLYHAVRLSSGNVFRLGLDRASVLGVLTRDVAALLVVVAALLALAWFASSWLARRLVRPILGIDPASGDARSPYVELEPLVGRLNDQHAQLVSRMERIRDVDDIRREFTANVTHELKTPIASISGAAELIRDGIARPEDVHGFAGRIYDDAQRLSALVSDILTLSKLDDSERAQDRELFGPLEACDLFSVVRDVAERYEARAHTAGVTLRVEGVSSPVRGNARLLDELVGNLLDNAVRYNRPGGKVFVWVLPVGGRPCVRVADTGIGIPAQDQPKVFERFYRVDKGRSRERGGTGLGLAIVKHAAAFHGASVRLESEVGEGTTVTVTFPG